MEILHHGAMEGVTGSCHELALAGGDSVLVDCGLFQGDDARGRGPEIDFPVDRVRTLLLTHVHLDHVGRLPYLLAAGFRGPILCTQPSARLLPAVLEDAVKVVITRDPRLVHRFLALIAPQVAPLPYGAWCPVPGCTDDLAVRLQPAGHILGSCFAEFRLGRSRGARRVVFSGDLGAPYTPLLPAPVPPYRADVLVLESTYGDKNHEGRRERREHLGRVLEHALADGGTVVTPAFSIGRTQELLYELEGLRHPGNRAAAALAAVEVILDSPLAARFTDLYRDLREFWDAEARRRRRAGRHPLSFAGLTTVGTHQAHLATVRRVSQARKPTVVIAASGMCTGGRVVRYLEALVGEAANDVLLVGYQARGTPGRALQTYGPRGGWFELEGRRVDIRAGVHTLSGYSAHAGQGDLVRFVRRMRVPPTEIRLVHGEAAAKRALEPLLQQTCPNTAIRIHPPYTHATVPSPTVHPSDTRQTTP